jgi:serine protease Do
MKSNSRLICLLLAVPVLLTLGLAAKDEAVVPPKAAVKKPTLIVDNTPLSQGLAPGMVTSYADVVEPVQKAVVSVYSTKIVHQRVPQILRQLYGDQIPSEHDSKEQGLGSGVIVSPDGYILTNNHVVEGADELKVQLPDEREFTAKVIGADPKTDIAVIKIEADNLPTVTLTDSDKLRVGDIVFAVGNPLEVGETVTMGIVSAKGRQVGILENGYESFIQTDAAINLGNSGGALLDAKGRLVGINSAIISPSRGNIGIGFAVPVNLAASIMESLITTGTVKRGFLGVSTNALTPDVADLVGLPVGSTGAIVSDVTPDSPAAKAGVLRSDVILGVNEKPVTNIEDLHFMIGQMLPGAKVALKIMRDGKPRTISLVLGSLTDNPNELVKGVNATRLTDELRRKLDLDSNVDGLVVTSVAKDSPYVEQLEANLVIVEIDRRQVSDLPSARSALAVGRHLLFVYDKGSRGFIRLVVRDSGQQPSG